MGLPRPSRKCLACYSAGERWPFALDTLNSQREREHGTIEHLLVMPVTPTEIMLAKIWAMSMVVLVSAAFSLVFIVQGILKVPIEGSVALFLIGTTLHLLAATSISRSNPVEPLQVIDSDIVALDSFESERNKLSELHTDSRSWDSC